MSDLLHDPRRVRELRRACWRTGEVRSRPWWLWRRKAAQATGESAMTLVVFRLGLTIFLAVGAKQVADQPLAIHLLSLAGLVLMQARIIRLRMLLDSDPALAVLAQLPVPDWQLFTYQLRQRWLGARWTLLDATGFWTVAWLMLPNPAPWAWLPVVAATHAAVTEAMALLLVRVWPIFGFTLLALGGAMVFGVMNHQQYPWLWTIVEPLLHVLAWVTPWGWLNTMATQLPQNTYLGCVVAALGVLAACGIIWAYDRLRRTWALNPQWREVAGRPIQTWDADDPDDQVVAPSNAPDRQSSAGQTTSDADPLAPVRTALTKARNTASGERLLAMGWAGRHALAHCDADDRWLVDHLGPEGANDTTWCWALLLAALPAVVAIAGVSPLWAIGALAAILLVRRMPRRAAFCGAITASALLWPEVSLIVGILAPCGLAVLMFVPFLGGTWNGLPMIWTVLGTVPRTWRRMMRIMLITTGLRLLASIPIVALVIIATAFAIDHALAAAIGAGWMVVVLNTPCLLALRLVQRTPGGIDLGLGRRLLTTGNVCCLFAHMTAAGLLVSGACMTFNDPYIGIDRSGMMLTAIGCTVSLLNSGAHLVLLRHAYRRRVDLIPPV